jgi:tRNA G10  N-methylase Trm11
LDPFVGIGSTLISARDLERNAAGLVEVKGGGISVDR